MSRFIAIASIRLEHDYYCSSINDHLSLVLTSQTKELMRQRGVLFLQIAPNEWQWLIGEENLRLIEDGIWEASIMNIDPDFIRMISLEKDYAPQKLYQIHLGKEDIIINEKFHLHPVPNETKRQGEFCRIVLSSEQLLHSQQQLSVYIAPKYLINFQSRSYYWEYLFVFRNEMDLNGKDLKLETLPQNAIDFDSSEKFEDNRFGRTVWRIISKEKVKAQENYGFTLVLYGCTPSGGKKMISKFIPFPRPGRYVASDPDILREIYYL